MLWDAQRTGRDAEDAVYLERLAPTMSSSARIAALHYYPLKSARGIELERAPLTRAGFEDDRRWMLVTPAGRFITQREMPRLALLRPGMSRTALQLSAPQLPPICIPLARQGLRRSVTVWRDHCEAIDEGDEVAEWLRLLLDATAAWCASIPHSGA